MHPTSRNHTRRPLLLLSGALLLLAFCTNNKKPGTSNFKSAGDDTYHTDERYKYNHRTGTSGDYTYDYDVSGTDEEGNEVSGSIQTNGKYGSGTLENEDGEEVEVETEWVGKGELEVTDEDGNTYEVEIDNE